MLFFADVVQEYLQQPVVFAASAMVCFAYFSSLLTRLLDMAPEWLVLRFVGTVGAAVSAYMAWRQGWQLPVAIITAALLLNSPPRRFISPYLVALRILNAYATVFVLSLIAPSVTLTAATDGTLPRVAMSAARVQLLNVSRLVVHSPDGILLDHDNTRIDGGHAKVEAAHAKASASITIHGSHVRLMRLSVAALTVAGAGCVVDTVTVECTQPPCVHAAPGTRFRNIRVVGFDDVPSQLKVDETHCSDRSTSHPWLRCVSDAASLPTAPKWLRLEAQMPILVRFVVPIAKRGAVLAQEGVVAGWYAARVAWGHISTALGVGASIASLALDDVFCATRAALVETNITSSSWVGQHDDDDTTNHVECARHYPLLHAAVFYGTVLTWAVGIPTVGRGFMTLVEWDLLAASAVAEGLWSVSCSCYGPAIAIGAWVLHIAANLGGTFVPVVLDTTLTAYIDFITWYVSTQCTIGWVLAQGVGVTLLWASSIAWLGASGLRLAWGWYAMTSFPSHAAVAALQTMVVAISYTKEIRLRTNERGSSEGRFASVIGKMRSTGVAASVVAEDAGSLMIYVVAHAAAALIVFGGAFLGFLPLVGTLSLHVGFPIVSTWSALQLMGRADSKVLWLVILPARALFTVAFQWTVGDVIYRLVLELFTPLLIAGLILLLLLVVRRVASAKAKQE